MRKATLTVREKLEYKREIVVLIPDDMTERILDRHLSAAEGQGFHGIGDFLYDLKRAGIELAEPYDDDMSCPDEMEIECDEYEIIDPTEST